MRRGPIVSLLAAGALAAAGCGGGGGSGTTGTGGSTSTSTNPLHAALAKSVSSELQGSGLPSDYTSCVVGKVQNEVSDAEVSKLTGAAAAGNASPAVAARVHSAATQLGRRLGLECSREGKGVDFLRKKFEATLRSSTSVSPAFAQCLVKESRTQISDGQLLAVTLAELDPSTKARAQQQTQQIGVKLGRACKSAAG